MNKDMSTYNREEALNIQCSVSGERNSGTTFLGTLLMKNRLAVFEGLCMYNLQALWKHGFPGPGLKLVGDKVVNIFIIRELDPWLISMYHTPYYLRVFPLQSFGEFLISKLELSQRTDVSIDIENLKVLNYADENKTIFQVRYEKIRSYMKYFNENENIVMVNLKYIQDEKNCMYFIEELSKKYDLYIPEIYSSIDVHTKTNEPNIKNQTHRTVITALDRTIINIHEDHDIEKYVNNLTFEMK